MNYDISIQWKSTQYKNYKLFEHATVWMITKEYFGLRKLETKEYLLYNPMHMNFYSR